LKTAESKSRWLNLIFGDGSGLCEMRCLKFLRDVGFVFFSGTSSS
jgi:hypothetical protein